MKRLIPLLLLLPALASAQSRGELAFSKACAQCHQAQPPSTDKKRPFGARELVGPPMGQVLKKKNLEQIHTWVQAPQRIKPKTACDTRRLAPDDMDALMSFLATVTVPAPPPRRMRLQQQLNQQVEARAVREKAESQEKAKKSQPTNQGKK